MWEQLFLFCLLLFDVKAKEAHLKSRSQEDVCENGNGKILPVILNSEDNAVDLMSDRIFAGLRCR